MSYASPLSVAVEALPARSWMPVGSVRSSSSEPVGPVLTVTVHVASDPLTFVIDAPPEPLPDSEKLGAATPVTLSSNVTVHETLGPLVGVESARAIDDTEGA